MDLGIFELDYLQSNIIVNEKKKSIMELFNSFTTLNKKITHFIRDFLTQILK